MSTKIQILNEKQVDHYVDVLLPELNKRFSKKEAELKALAKLKVNAFIVDPKVIELKEKQEKELKEAKELAKLQLSLKAINENYTITSTSWRQRDLILTEEGIDKLQDSHNKNVEDLLLELAEKSYHVDNTYYRLEQMKDELRARLCMSAVTDFETITKAILSSINIDNFFTNEIIN